MPLRDTVRSSLARALDAPIREIVASALQDKGYASPAEVAALREEIARLQGQLRGLGERVTACETGLRDASSSAEALRAAAHQAQASAAAALARAEAAEASAAAAATATPPAPGVSRADRHRWRAGRLPTHVSPEGLIDLGGAPAWVDRAHAGRPYSVTGGVVHIDGQAVPTIPLA